MSIHDEVARYARESEVRAEKSRIEVAVLAGLLRGGSRFLGHEVELRFVDGQPNGMTNAELADWLEATT